MESVARPQATLVDLLDRVLDRGLVINADIIISLAGVPLIGINLRAALAGMETMAQYGVMQEWDQRSRAQGVGLPRVPEAATVVADKAPIGATHRTSEAQGRRWQEQ